MSVGRKWGMPWLLGLMMMYLLAGCGSDAAFDDGTSGGDSASLQVTVEPADGATGVPLNTMVTGTFNKDINLVTINDLTAYLLDDAGDKVPGTLSYNNRVMKFMPLANLAANKTYTFVITKDVQATDGSKLKNESRTSFTTGTGTALQVTINPPDGTTGVPVNPTITATFNEEMNLSTIGSNNIYLVDENGTLVPGTYQYDTTHTVVTFTPTGHLLPFTEYTFVVGGDATSVTGDQLSGDETSTFTTGSDDTLNLEVTVVPADGSTNVAINTMIVATFNKPMALTTLNSGNVYLVDENGTLVPGNIYFGLDGDNTVLTYILHGNLEPNSDYTFVIENDVTAEDGDQLATDSLTHFTTGSHTELQVYVYPSDGQTDVPINVQVKAIFNEELNESTLSDATVFLKDTNGSAVNGIIDYIDTTTTHMMTFTPTLVLDNNTTYVFTITQGVTAVNGDQLASNSMTSFTTGSGALQVKAGVFSLAPNTATVDTNESDLLGGLVGGLLGLQVEVDAAAVQGLAEVDLQFDNFLDALSSEQNASTFEELLSGNVSADTFLGLLSDQLGASGALPAQAVIDDLISQLDTKGLGDTLIPISSLLQLPTDMLPENISELLGQGVFSGATFSGFSLLEPINAALYPLLSNPIEVPLAIPGLTAGNSGLRVQVVTAPTLTVMEEGDSVHSSATRIQLNLALGADLLGGLLSGINDLLSVLSPGNTVTADLLNLPLYVELGSAEANLTALSAQDVAMNVKGGLTRLYIGTIDDNLFFSQERLSPDDFGPVTLLNVLDLVTVTVKGYAVGDTNATELHYLPVSRVQTLSAYAPAGSDTGTLLVSLLHNLDLHVTLLGSDALDAVVQALLGDLVTPLIDGLVPATTPLLNSVSELLGTYAGRTDVTLYSLVQSIDEAQ